MPKRELGLQAATELREAAVRVLRRRIEDQRHEVDRNHALLMASQAVGR